MKRPFASGSRAAACRSAAPWIICAFVSLAGAERALAVFLEGIDVSHWQGNINWTSVKNAGVKFAFTKATEGVNFVDSKFHANMQGARSAGVYVGPYHFCRVESKDGVPFTSYDGSPFQPGSAPYVDAVTEAEDFLEAILPYYQTGLHLPPVADVERLPDFGNQTLNRLFISNWVQLFSDTVYDALGVRPLIYTSRFGANTRYTPEVASSHELWLAWWRGTGTTQPPQPSDTPLWDPWLFWQWTDSWSVAGVAGAVDGDVFNGTLQQLEELLLGDDGAIAGDYNRDGSVDAADYLIWRKTSGQIVPLYSGADGDGNSRVDAADYAVWKSNLGQTAGGGPATSAASVVPEPTAAVLMLIGLGLASWLLARPNGIQYARTATFCCAVAFCAALATPAAAQQSSASAWEAAGFRSWSFIPYWTSVSQVHSFATDRVYDHISDVVYHSGVQPREDGSLFTGSTAANHLAVLKNHQAQFGFRYHLDMFDAVRNPGESAAAAVERVWNAITSSPTTRATFINNVQNVLAANNMTGFNLDWERPNTVTEWGNYTQLAREMQATFPEHWEVSVDDYGFADSRWDDSPLFDARVYDQIGIMGYHYPANNGTSLDQQSFADGKKALTGQGAEKAFKDSQIILGMGTWGSGSPTVRLKDIVAVDPNLPADASSFTGTVPDLNGTPRTGTWDIVSRYEVRDIVQLALDRGMAGVMWWALSYDATNEMSLARVAQHYAMFQRGVPDLTLDGKVNAADAHALADNMGGVPGWTGTNTAARFEDFYMSGNWEVGDRDGNGFVNQQDADWLAGRFAALGVNLPDRLAYTGTLENHQDSRGLTGRWRAQRETNGSLRETGNYTQHGAGQLAWSGSGVGADKHSSHAVTFRNQNAAERFDSLNTLPRQMEVDLAAPIDLSQDEETYVTFLVRQNTGPLLSNHLTSNNRTLSLEFLDAAGENQFDFTFRGSQQEFAIQSQADAASQDVSTSGFAPDATFLFVGKIAGGGGGANTLQASLFASGASVDNFADPSFPWMLTAQSSAGFNPTVTELQFTSLFEANYTVSNVWVGTAAKLFALPSAAMGDFNADGTVDAADYLVWRKTLGQSGALLAADANGNGWVDAGDYGVWVSHLGQTTGLSAAADHQTAVPEPASWMLLLLGLLAVNRRGRP